MAIFCLSGHLFSFRKLHNFWNVCFEYEVRLWRQIFSVLCTLYTKVLSRHILEGKWPEFHFQFISLWNRMPYDRNGQYIHTFQRC